MQLTVTAVQSKSFVTRILSDKFSSLSIMFYFTFHNVFSFRNYSTKLLKMSGKRIAASRALEILQNLPSDCSDNDGSDSEIDPVVNAALTSVPVKLMTKFCRIIHFVVQGEPGLI